VALTAKLFFKLELNTFYGKSMIWPGLEHKAASVRYLWFEFVSQISMILN